MQKYTTRYEVEFNHNLPCIKAKFYLKMIKGIVKESNNTENFPSILEKLTHMHDSDKGIKADEL